MKNQTQKRAFYVLTGCIAALALCIAAALALLCGTPAAQDVSIPGTRGTIYATVQLPGKLTRSGDMPLAVLCHGFTGSRAGDGHFAPLAQELAAQGIATVRLDFPGCGDSTEPFTAYTLSHMADDVESAILYMQSTYGTGPTALVGHSSAVEAMAAEAEANGSVTAWGVELSAAYMDEMRTSDPNAALRESALPTLLTYSGSEGILSSTTQAETIAAVQSLPDGQVVLDPFVAGNHNYLSDDPATAAALDKALRQTTVRFLTQYLG